MWDSLWLDARIATMVEGLGPYGLIDDAALATREGHIAWLGPARDLPGSPERRAREVHRLSNHCITPGLIDCHTHLVHGGNRAREFEMRLQGASYQELARAGGGILSTVRATREADETELYRDAVARLRALMAEGVTTLEVKSGYGLDRENEMKQLRVARRLGSDFRVTVTTTFLGAHALPPEFADDADGYVDAVAALWLPALAAQGLVDAVDAFCEGIGFSAAQTRRVFEAARELDLPVKLHADQLSDLGGAGLVAEFGGWSADHVEYSSEASIAAMAAAGTVAVLLPGAFYALRETRMPPIDAFRERGVAMAVATDLNPGTAPLLSLRLALNFACTLFRLTPIEALRGVTVNAARALGLADRGRLAVGQRADFAVWPLEQPAELAYWIGGGGPARVFAAGQERTGLGPPMRQ
jgi:imidazolonepropionase